MAWLTGPTSVLWFCQSDSRELSHVQDVFCDLVCFCSTKTIASYGLPKDALGFFKRGVIVLIVSFAG